MRPKLESFRRDHGPSPAPMRSTAPARGNTDLTSSWLRIRQATTERVTRRSTAHCTRLVVEVLSHLFTRSPVGTSVPLVERCPRIPVENLAGNEILVHHIC